MGWFEDTIGAYPDPKRHPKLFVPSLSPPEKFSGSYGNMRGWQYKADEGIVARYLYPVAWFDQMQKYVAALLYHRPLKNAPVGDQVDWSLALMGAISEGLFALNANDIAWGALYYGVNEVTPPYAKLINDNVTVKCNNNRLPGCYRRVTAFDAQDVREVREMRVAQATPNSVNPQFGRMNVVTAWRVPYEENPGQDAVTDKDVTDLWPTAPFLHPPLIFDHQKYVHKVSRRCEARVHTGPVNATRAAWWNDLIAGPLAEFCPWATGGKDRMYSVLDTPIGVLARDPERSVADSKGRHQTGWGPYAFYTDNQATASYLQEIQSKDAKRIHLAHAWKLLAFSFRHLNAPVQWDTHDKAPAHTVRANNAYVPTLTDIYWGAQLSRGAFLPPFPLFAENTGASRIRWNATYDFATAYDGGDYDSWGVWFVDIDMPSLMYGLSAGYSAYLASGYVDFVSVDKAQKLAMRGFVSKKDWDAAEKGRKLDKAGPVLNVVMRIVGFVVAIATLSVQSLITNIVGMIEDIADKGKKKGLLPWQMLDLMPQGFLRSLREEPSEFMLLTMKEFQDYVPPTGGHANFDVGYGGTGEVLEKIANSMQDTMAVVQKLWVPRVPGTGRAFLEHRPLPERGAPTERAGGAAPPSQGGPPVALPFVKPDTPSTDWMKYGLWGGAVVAVSYGVWRTLKPAQRNKAKRVVTRTKAKVRRLVG